MLLLDRRGHQQVSAIDNDTQLPGDTPPHAIPETLLKRAAITIHFGSFADGRGLSLAAHLRNALAYTGTIRASGELLPDQLTELFLSGFDEVLVTNGSHDDDWIDASNPVVERSYISASTDNTRCSIWQQRHAATR